MPSCFQCYSTIVAVYHYVWRWVWRWITATWQECSEEDCNWWVLCLNKVVCWLVTGLVFALALTLFIVVEFVVVVLCTVISVWCWACRSICWAGCFGDEKCWRNCVENGPCDGPIVEVDTDFPMTTVSGMFSGSGKSKTRTAEMRRAPRVVELRRVADLDSIVGSGLAAWLGNRQRVKVVLAGASEATSRRLQSVADRYVTACGCKEGQLGLLSGVLVAALRLQGGPPLGAAEMTSAAGWVILGAFLGKAFGLVKSRLDFMKSLRGFSQVG